MRRPWRVLQLANPIEPTEDAPRSLAEKVVVFRGLSFWAAEGRSAPSDPDYLRLWEDVPPYRVAIMAGLDWAYGNGARVIAMSLAIPPNKKYSHDALWVLVEELVAREVAIIVAAGNWGPHGLCNELAQMQGVISVGAVAADGELLPSSSRCNGLGIPSFVADGRDLHEDTLPAGTSFAVPRVAHYVVFLRSVLNHLAQEFHSLGEGADAMVDLPEPSRLAFLDTGFDTEAVKAQSEARRGPLELYPEGQELESYGDSARKAWLETYLRVAKAQDLHFQVTNSVEAIRRLLQIAAVPSSQGRDGYGSGLLPYEDIQKVLSTFTPTRFHAAFGETPADADKMQVLVRLDEQLGPLWDDVYEQFLWQIYGREFRAAYAKVL